MIEYFPPLHIQPNPPYKLTQGQYNAYCRFVKKNHYKMWKECREMGITRKGKKLPYRFAYRGATIEIIK